MWIEINPLVYNLLQFIFLLLPFYTTANLKVYIQGWFVSGYFNSQRKLWREITPKDDDYEFMKKQETKWSFTRLFRKKVYWIFHVQFNSIRREAVPRPPHLFALYFGSSSGLLSMKKRPYTLLYTILHTHTQPLVFQQLVLKSLLKVPISRGFQTLGYTRAHTEICCIASLHIKRTRLGRGNDE